MVLIPNDIGIRMRLQNEAQLLQPLAPITEIASDLPQLRAGQVFTARILEALPQGTYKALVAGNEITLSLPAGAKVDDSLELVVVDRSARVIVAQLANPAAVDEAGQPYPFTNLSRAAQLIGGLLPAQGDLAAPAPLNAGRPVLDAAPTAGATSAAQLASSLASAVKRSGLFYEAHQAQWVTGRYPLAQLLDEPQAQHSDFKRLVAYLVRTGGEPASGLTSPSSSTPGATAATAPGLAGQGSGTLGLGTPGPGASGFAPLRPNAQAGIETSPENTKSALAGRHLEGNSGAAGVEARALDVTSTSTGVAARHAVDPLSGQAAGTLTIPEDIRPIVQQQLDALATQRMVWHGEAWPQQFIEWQIDRDGHAAGTDDDGDQWNTTLTLTTPGLGEVGARLQLGPAGVRIVVSAQSPGVAENMRAAMPALQSALEAAGVPLRGFLARDASAPETGPSPSPPATGAS